jgi:iron complex outermembrane receptor protein
LARAAPLLAAGLKKKKSACPPVQITPISMAPANPTSPANRDSRNATQQRQTGNQPAGRLTLNLDGSHSRVETRYVGAMTLAEYEANPAQNSGNTYTHQKFDSDVWGAGLAYLLAPGLTLAARHWQEDKVSDYVTFASRADYDYQSDDLALQYRGGGLSVTAGVQTFDGTRIGSTSRTSKDNFGWFLHGQYNLGATTVSAGARAENVEYRHAPDAGAALEADHDLSAWDIGINHRLDTQLSLFANYNQAFQTPDIDRFFNFDGTFNAFIAPAESRTVNVGLNHVTPANRLKLALFHADLDDEIYFNILTFTNTNLDKTHKYGLSCRYLADRAGAAASIN